MTEKEIEFLLVKLGFSMTARGFYYLSDILDMILRDTTCIFNLSANAYKTVADQFHITSSGVERAIRSEIQRIWDTDPTEIKNISFNDLKYKPTVKELLSLLLAYLKFHED